MAAELLPRQLFHQFLQRADAARQCNERIGALEHQPFAFVHVGRDDQFLAARHGVFAGDEKLRNDADDFAAMVPHGFGNGAHQADRAATIDETDAVLGEGFSERASRFNK